MAITDNGHDMIILVGFAIAEVECEPIGEWFLDHLKRFIVRDP